MKLSAAQIEQTLDQLEAEAVPPEHPMMPQLARLYGDHTYFIDDNGLNIVEPVATPESNDGRRGVVVNIASWADEAEARLKPHPPQPTELVIVLAADD